MADPITAAMVGAAISGGTSLAQGKSLGKSLESAAIGGALGGAGGALGGALGGAGGAAAGSGAGAGTGTAAGTAAGTAGSTAGTAAAGTIESAGLIFNPATGTYLNPSYFAGATSGMPLYTGAGSTLSQIGTGLGSLGSNISNIMPGDVLMNNPLGYGKLALDTYGAMNQQPQPMQAQPAQVSRGKGSIQYEPLLTTQIPRRKYPLSLLG